MLGPALGPVLTIMYKVVVLSGLISAWYGGNTIAAWFGKQKWFVWLSAFSFMIYAIHAPLVAYVTEAVYRIYPGEDHRLLFYLAVPSLIIAVSVAVGALLRWVAPAVYGILTGGRGVTPPLTPPHEREGTGASTGRGRGRFTSASCSRFGS